MNESKPVDLEAVRARVNEASKGPWTCEGDKISGIMKIDSLRRVVGPEFFDSDGNDYCEVCEDIRHIGNAEFISNSRQDIPALCDEVELLRERVKVFTERQLQEVTGVVKDALLNKEQKVTFIKATLKGQLANPKKDPNEV